MCTDHDLRDIQPMLDKLNENMIAKCPAPALLGHRPDCKGDCDREITFKEMVRA